MRLVPSILGFIVLPLLLAGTACANGDDDAASSGVPTAVVEPTRQPDAPPLSTPIPAPAREPSMRTFVVPSGSRPHDVAPAADGGVWYTAQGSGKLGWLDPKTGDIKEIDLGAGSAPHGVIVDKDGAAWVTAGGINAIVRVDAVTHAVQRYPLPTGRNVNLNTATLDRTGRVWFTGQGGVYGVLDPRTGDMRVFDAPRGNGPYGITTTPGGDVYYSSLAGSYLGRVNIETGSATVLQPPTANQGARRAWTDSKGRIWVSEWNAGQVGVFDAATNSWKEWKLPGARPQAYAVYVDELDKVWLTDFGANAIVRFDPVSEDFTSFPLPDRPGNVRQLHGRPGEVWGALSGNDKLVVIEY